MSGFTSAARQPTEHRLSNVQVTLQILKALIEKCARDLPIFASYVLQILHDVLHSHHVGLLESSIPTFEAFCNSYDPAQFAADRDHLNQYNDIITHYAAFASKDGGRPTKVPPSTNIAVRNRKAGMQALKALLSADSFTADNGQKLRLVLPVVLENVYSDAPGLLMRLKLRETAKDGRERDQGARPRPSTNASFAESSSEVDPMNASATAEDLDERASEEVGVLAMQCLRQMFSTDVPAQLRVATQSIITFIDKHDIPDSRSAPSTPSSNHMHDWATELFVDLSRWTSVQSRFIVLVSLTDTLTKSPIVESNLDIQLLLVGIIGALLRSDITFIGLSVNDVLIGFVNHILLLLQLGGQGSGVRPHPQQTIADGLVEHTEDQLQKSSKLSGEAAGAETVKKPSSLRIKLLDDLSSAIGNLATHVYYADQISEMVSAILLRLKPPINMMQSTAMAIENPANTADMIADSGRLQEKPHTDSYFSFDTARVLALNAIKSIIETANSRRKEGQGTSNRNRVNTMTWDGTQWLLRDPCGQVRRAYVDSLMTWMFFELDKSNLRVPDEYSKRTRASKPNATWSDGHAIARRALSNASKRSIPNLRAHSNFMQLLHLAIYDSALQYAECESDVLLLHLLLVSTIQKLGVNSVRHGLPMIFRLQEEIPRIESVTAKDAIGSLVHGYFWALSEFFDFDTTAVGRDIANEISRRSQLGLWLSPVSVPALPLERIKDPPDAPPAPPATTSSQRTHALKPLTSREAVIECINNAYSGSLLSPPSSPQTSPRRPVSARSGSYKPPEFKTAVDHQLPQDIREQLAQPWSREACIAEIDKKLGRSSSVTASKSGSGSGRGGYLTANGVATAGHSPEPDSSQNISEIDLNRPTSQGKFTTRISPDRGSVSAPGSASGRQSNRVGELRRISETSQPSKFAYRFSQPVPTNDADSDSMVSAEASSVN